MLANDQEKIKIAREYLMRADQGRQTFLNCSMKMRKFISLNLDLDGICFLQWLRDSKVSWNTFSTTLTD